ncbi:DUF4296 domain-containing protein [Rhodohalobacter sp. 8-1]|uniref:DUF4296 domain-containing protein n=1 Tax=Rhodohalobacter sp. 8-1 TaxID=3131972 RepID=UPI0030EB4184
MKRSFPFVFLMVSLLIFVSCSNTTAPEDLVEEDRYITVFTELVVINQLNETQLDSVSRDYLKEQIFEKYNVTPEQFERTHLYYQKQPEQQLQRIDKIEESLTEERDQLQDRLNENRKQLADSLAAASDTLPRPGPAEELIDID